MTERIMGDLKLIDFVENSLIAFVGEKGARGGNINTFIFGSPKDELSYTEIDHQSRSRLFAELHNNGGVLLDIRTDLSDSDQAITQLVFKRGEKPFLWYRKQFSDKFHPGFSEEWDLSEDNLYAIVNAIREASEGL